MKTNLILALITTAMLAVAPPLRAKDAQDKPGRTEAAEVAGKETPAKPEAPKNLTRAENTKLKAAREKADADPAVAAAATKAEVAKKKYTALNRAKGTTPEALISAKNDSDAAQQAYVKARREVIAKEDPDAAKFDERAYAIGDRLRKAGAVKDAARDKEADEEKAGKKARHDKAGEGDAAMESEKGKGRDHAPGQLKKEKGGDAGDFAPGRQKEKKDKSDE